MTQLPDAAHQPPPAQAEGQEQRSDDEPVARRPSPTAGMNIAQRILHVGGRDNAAGYVEFGSIQAVEALVRQVLRDLPEQGDHWQQYAKPGETAQQCIERHRAEQDALMTLLAQARSEQNAKAEGQEAVAFLDPKTGSAIGAPGKSRPRAASSRAW